MYHVSERERALDLRSDPGGVMLHQERSQTSSVRARLEDGVDGVDVRLQRGRGQRGVNCLVVFSVIQCEAGQTGRQERYQSVRSYLTSHVTER